MELVLENAAKQFCSVLNNHESVQEFNRARDAYESSEEVYEMRKEYTQLVQDLRARQTQGALTEDDVKGLRSLEEKINAHELTGRLAQAQSRISELLQTCNSTISKKLGFDYASSAAPPKSCGC